MSDCLFCRIIDRQIPSKILYEDDRVIAIEDINPQAPLHALVIPKTHIATLNDLAGKDDVLLGEMTRCAAALAKQRGFSERGFRAVFNTNSDAGQTVFHIHLHVLAGRSFLWPPG